MDGFNPVYFELEQNLYYLRLHFEMCDGARDPEVGEWCRFFVDWSRKASKSCGTWSRGNLETAEQILKVLEKSKSGLTGFETLKGLMSGAHQSLNAEIKDNLKKKKAADAEKTEGKKLVANHAAGASELMEDTDQPRGRRGY